MDTIAWSSFGVFHQRSPAISILLKPEVYFHSHMINSQYGLVCNVIVSLSDEAFISRCDNLGDTVAKVPGERARGYWRYQNPVSNISLTETCKHSHSCSFFCCIKHHQIFAMGCNVLQLMETISHNKLL